MEQRQCLQIQKYINTYTHLHTVGTACLHGSSDISQVRTFINIVHYIDSEFQGNFIDSATMMRFQSNVTVCRVKNMISEGLNEAFHFSSKSVAFLWYNCKTLDRFCSIKGPVAEACGAFTSQ